MILLALPARVAMSFRAGKFVPSMIPPLLARGVEKMRLYISIQMIATLAHIIGVDEGISIGMTFGLVMSNLLKIWRQ